MKTTDLNEDIVLLPLGVYLRRYGTLVISDLHIGYEHFLEQNGVQVPFTSYSIIKNNLLEHIKICSPEKIIIAGDLKQDFIFLNDQEIFEMSDLFGILNRQVEVVLGNHDIGLIPLLNKLNIKYHNKFIVLGDDILITHGHLHLKRELLSLKVKTIICGHQHPTIKLIDPNGVENKFKATLSGNSLGRKIVILPAFSPLKHGIPLNDKSQKFVTPFLKHANYDSLVVHIFEIDEWYGGPQKLDR